MNKDVNGYVGETEVGCCIFMWKQQMAALAQITKSRTLLTQTMTASVYTFQVALKQKHHYLLNLKYWSRYCLKNFK